ncbi:STAS domain-containing protein [Streptomyces aureocirculatus]|uniref:STAS domain-containing protein n=1 Tax=Streptomyces aureocirculatus TaxID=67275 RepID=UPI0004C48319|nr:STAS domain-containing protein [Streptomyces aureocirculatus]
MEQDAEPRLVIRQVPAGRTATVICLSGELDFDTVALLREEIVQVAAQPGRRRLLLELSAVTYCDNAGLFTLLGMCRALDAVGIAVGIIETGLVAGAAIDRAGLQDQLPLRRSDP